MSETFVCHIIFYLPENSLGFDAPSAPLPDSLFGSKPFPGFALVPVEPVVHLYSTVTLCLEAPASERTSLAPLCPVSCTLSNIPACRPAHPCTNAPQVLPHGTDVIVFILIIVETLLTERVLNIARTLLNVEAVVLDEGFHAVLLHEPVVFFRAIA